MRLPVASFGGQSAAKIIVSLFDLHSSLHCRHDCLYLLLRDFCFPALKNSRYEVRK